MLKHEKIIFVVVFHEAASRTRPSKLHANAGMNSSDDSNVVTHLDDYFALKDRATTEFPKQGTQAREKTEAYSKAEDFVQDI